jgi:hypothetical protein
MIERRALERIPIKQAALLSFDGIRGVHPCVVRDISAFGACISAPYYIFARDFGLSFNGFDRIFICRVAWRKGTLCGVSFVQRPGSPKSANDSDELAKVVRLDRQTAWQRCASSEAPAAPANFCAS